MRIVLVGAGGLATNLGLALHEAGHDVLAVFSRTMEHAQMLAERIGSQPTDDICALPDEADLFIVSVKDAVLTDVVQQLVQGREEQFFAHTAGSMPLELFQGMARHYGVFYPMQSFSKERRINFSEVPVFLEASDAQTLTQPLRHTSTNFPPTNAGICIWQRSLPATLPTTAMPSQPRFSSSTDCLSVSCCLSSTRRHARCTTCHRSRLRRGLPYATT